MDSTVMLHDHVRRELNGLALPQGVPMLVAVSGGMDSMVLLTVLHRLQYAPLIVAHLDHGLRENSSKDAACVASYAALLGIPCITERIDVLSEATHVPSSSLEAVARNVRYSFLRRTMKASGASCLVTAHTASDQAETILMHLARGSSVRGMSGMAPRYRDIVRPLLQISRAEINEYRTVHQIPFCHDETNDDISYERNFIRHRVIPLLTERHQSFIKTTARNAVLWRDVDSYLYEQAYPWVETVVQNGDFTVIDFTASHPALQREMLSVLFEELYGSRENMDMSCIEGTRAWILNGTSGTQYAFGPQVWFALEHGRISIIRSEASVVSESASPLTVPGVTKWSGYHIEAVIRDGSESTPMLYNTAVALFDHAALGVSKSLCVRSVLPGDRFVCTADGHSRKVSDYFIDEKIPKRSRSHIPIIATAENEIVWIAGYRPSERFKATGKSRQVVQLTCR